MDDLTKKKIENAKQILANGNCSAIECRFCLACPSGIPGHCIAENKRRVPIDGLSDAGIDFFKSKIAEYEGGEMKYKVGDIVIAKKGLVPGTAYGSVAFFIDVMVPYCGRKMKIKEVHKDYYDVEENNYGWTEEMLEPVAVFKQYIDEKTKEKQYHLGEKVKISNRSGIFTIIERTFSETGDIIYIAKNNKYAVTVNPSDIIPACLKPGQDEIHFTVPVHVNGMTFNMIVDSAVGTKKHETRKEIRKRLLKL